MTKTDITPLCRALGRRPSRAVVLLGEWDHLYYWIR
jgi:hypothetical protein